MIKSGFVNIIKPTGESSSNVVCKIKKILGTKKVGHLGTLDPAAAGVLPIAFGKATKFFDYFLNKDKKYFAIAEFGVLTDTLDSEGEIVVNNPTSVTKEQINTKIKSFLGEINQTPPLYSAISINGYRAYELARNGEVVDMPSRKVQIYDFNVVDKIDENKFSFVLHCSSGTYVRSLLLDLAKSLGTVANIPVIIRLASGCFNLNDAVLLDEIRENCQQSLIKVEDVLPNLKRINFEKNHYKQILNGVIINNNYNVENGEEFLGYINNKLFGLFICQNGQISCKINLYEGE